MKSISLLTKVIFFVYVLLLIFFNYVDVYHLHFFSKGLIVIAYNIMRLCFMGYLAWILYFTGDSALNYGVRNNVNQCMTLESVIAAFFSGVGIWCIGLLVVGLVGFYYRFLMEAITVLLLFASLPRLDCWVQFAVVSKTKIYWPGLLLLMVPVFIFLLTKGLYPAGGHDYYSHYFYFYRTVVDTGSILPNEVWYQFYYSKGAALFFLSMLLTDPLAPQLATTAMVFFAAAIIFSLLKRKASFRLLPWIGAALYIAFLIYTPGPLDAMRNGGWGDLEKLHEQAAILVLAIIYMTIRIAEVQNTRPWGMALGLTASALVLISFPVAIFAGAYLTGAALLFALNKKKSAVVWSFSSIVLMGFWSLVLLAINYILTGLPQDQALFFFWDMINFDKVKSWGVLLQVLILHWVKTGLVANEVPLTRDFIPHVLSYLRLDIWGTLLLSAVTVLIISFCKKQWRQRIYNNLDTMSLLACGGFLVVVVLLSIFIGRDQPISFYRFTSFTYAPTLCVCLLLLSAILRNRIALMLWIILPGLVVLGFPICSVLFSEQGQSGNQILMIIDTAEKSSQNVGAIVRNAMRFARGKYSIAEAYQHQYGWPGRMPWGGIYPATETVWRLLPPKTRIWSMNLHSYCMLPDCHMENWMSFLLSPHTDLVFFGNAAKAKEVLQKEKLNYFFISKSLQLKDPLPLAPLFSPGHIADYLGIAWTDGDSTLLTWKENAIMPINKNWLVNYNHLVNQSATIASFPYRSMQAALILFKQKNSHVASSAMPWYAAGWHATHAVVMLPKQIDGIDIKDATYGGNCKFKRDFPFIYGVSTGNVTDSVKQKCQGKRTCNITVDAKTYGDPASGCAKDFRVTYYCSSHHEFLSSSASAEALGKNIVMDCEKSVVVR